MGSKKKKSRNFGHINGLNAVEKVIKSSIKSKIPYLTLYTFSTENWRRPKNEVNFLFNLIRNSLSKNIKKIIKNGIKVNIIGKKSGLPRDIKKIISLIKDKTKLNKNITLNIALNYGSKEEILNAIQKLKGKRKFSIIDFEKNLYTNGMPDPDILIRTGGTKRLSNFLLWQCAYTEIFFVNKLWPDFNEKNFNNIIKTYYKIKRNYGKI